MYIGLFNSSVSKKIRNAVAVFAALFTISAALAAPNAMAWGEKKNTAKKEAAVQQVSAKVSINKADVDTLANLTGVGPAKAEAIVAYRKANGGFKSIEQLKEVKGIGEATIKKNRDRLVL